MSIENEIETLEKRTLEAEKNWLEFLSDLPLREGNLTLRNQTLDVPPFSGALGFGVRGVI